MEQRYGLPAALHWVLVLLIFALYFAITRWLHRIRDTLTTFAFHRDAMDCAAPDNVKWLRTLRRARYAQC